MVAKVVLIVLALVVSIGLSTWALAWAYRRLVTVRGETARARYRRDEAMLNEAEKPEKLEGRGEREERRERGEREDA